MKKALCAIILFSMVSSANAYDPGQASGYDHDNTVDRGLFKEDNSARQMIQELNNDGDARHMQDSYTQDAEKEQRRQEHEFFNAQKYSKPKKPRRIR